MLGKPSCWPVSLVLPECFVLFWEEQSQSEEVRTRQRKKPSGPGPECLSMFRFHKTIYSYFMYFYSFIDIYIFWILKPVLHGLNVSWSCYVVNVIHTVTKSLCRTFKQCLKLPLESELFIPDVGSWELLVRGWLQFSPLFHANMRVNLSLSLPHGMTQ